MLRELQSAQQPCQENNNDAFCDYNELNNRKVHAKDVHKCPPLLSFFQTYASITKMARFKSNSTRKMMCRGISTPNTYMLVYPQGIDSYCIAHARTDNIIADQVIAELVFLRKQEHIVCRHCVGPIVFCQFCLPVLSNI